MLSAWLEIVVARVQLFSGLFSLSPGAGPLPSQGEFRRVLPRVQELMCDVWRLAAWACDAGMPTPELCNEFAQYILNRHNQAGVAEADIRAAVRDFLIETGLAEREEIDMEQSPLGLDSLVVLILVEADPEPQAERAGVGGDHPAGAVTRQLSTPGVQPD